ncbi:hypothetical protein CONPUDRAFT_120915 [Coniophora puteana RWD-64-598 SS2]|uniref:CENP-V/GFA domain-containing protein n=1 Tax=Coniophora puteana (strain RWD-64-598) TaxID=741705 RepID=A0A5M3MUR4_CONPW|nr:uncharacterized protein CONPUDRAFT_120915 [Coniophora puteana RWD-64-598 SS2]EIW82780.1 hypothetical protein CONPUDRAFT_120915 [Coniophora puteana RWD-64-598 SS2]
MSAEPTIHRGACLCESIKYEITTARPSARLLCHCRDCQKSTGSAFATMVAVPKADCRVTQGSESLRSYALSTTKSGNTMTRSFCTKCGSPLFAGTTKYAGSVTIINAGTLDDPTKWPPVLEVFCTNRMEWLRPLEGGRQFDEEPPRHQ